MAAVYAVLRNGSGEVLTDAAGVALVVLVDGAYLHDSPETAAATEASAATAAATADRAESAAATEASAATAAATADQAETAAAEDSATATMAAAQDQAETAAATDVGSATGAFDVTQAETAAATDEAVATQATEAAVAETAAATDTSNAAVDGAFTADAQESMTVADSTQGVSDNVPDDLDVKLVGGGNVKFKPLTSKKPKRELPLAADTTNMPDAPPPATRYELGILAALAMNTSLPVPEKVIPAPLEPAPAPEKVIPAPLEPAPAANYEKAVDLVAELAAELAAAKQRVRELELEQRVAEIEAQAVRRVEVERQVAEIESRIVARRTTNAHRAQEIVRKIMNSH